MQRTQTATNASLKLTKSQRDEVIVNLFLDGHLPKEIAQHLGRGVTVKRIEQVLSDRGYEAARFHFEDQEIDQWVAMYNGDWDGWEWSINQIAINAKRSWGTVALRVAERINGPLRHRAKSMKLTMERRKAEGTRH